MEALSVVKKKNRIKGWHKLSSSSSLVVRASLSQRNIESSNHGMSEEEKEAFCEKLTEELINTFTEDFVKEGLTVKKEKLIGRFLALGGEGYTHEDLINDLIRMEELNNLRGLEQY